MLFSRARRRVTKWNKFPLFSLATSYTVVWKKKQRGAQIPAARPPWPQNLVLWLLIFVGLQYGTCFMSPFSFPEFSGDLQIFGKMCATLAKNVINLQEYCQLAQYHSCWQKTRQAVPIILNHIGTRNGLYHQTASFQLAGKLYFDFQNYTRQLIISQIL